ncbi:conserved hypothetical protein [Candidatus Nitrosymbiomonas proteolyticus]|uniref:3-keto-alpha-glucoside-1,2-lyase/3-keto-2-hydroxy-glucal hydratase domain-containing protein n=1 Tax=Candidatus Nitrosymbiomonas proteolyticus TaxID=2608984 RepID=A0A809RDN2_9BACT|nr:conserved hypothetical protein [Candidatus Nitrosymbiomonas proteolyticus]
MIALCTATCLIAWTQIDTKPGVLPLFDGKSLKGWTQDVPENDGKPEALSPFVVREGMLVSLGKPMGHLISGAEFENYRLLVEWRWPKGAGNSGVIVHVSQPRFLRGFLPKGIEAQLMSGNAGDFHLFGEELFRAEAPAEKAGKNLTDDSEKPLGEWNQMVVECLDDAIKVWVNGTLVNHGVKSSVRKGKIALQSEGAEIEFRKVELTRLRPSSP